MLEDIQSEKLLKQAYNYLCLNEVEKGLDLFEQVVNAGANLKEPLEMAANFNFKAEFEIARTLTECMLRYNNKDYNLWNLLGVVLKNLNHFDDALQAFKKAISINNNQPEAWMNLGNLFSKNRKMQEALQCYKKAGDVAPNNIEAIRLQGATYINLGDHVAAESILSKALSIDESNANVLTDLAAACYNQGKYQDAFKVINQALKLDPTPKKLRFKGAIMIELGKGLEAIKILEAVREYAPKDIDNLVMLGGLYHKIEGDSFKAKLCYEEAYSYNDQNPKVLKRLCDLLLSIKKTDGSQAEFISFAHICATKLLDSEYKMDASAVIQSIALKLLDYEMYDKISNKKELLSHLMRTYNDRALMLQMSRVENLQDKLDIVEAHRICGAYQESKIKKIPLKAKLRSKNDKVRIGIMSSDLRNHVVGCFAWPLIEHLDRSKFDICCYSFFPFEEDHIQSSIKKLVNEFRCYKPETDEYIAEQIAKDNIDILFELGGKTMFSKTSVCLYKPAPVQVSWLGYPHSVGYPSVIDYIVVDPYINPPDSRLIIEKPFVLPDTWVSLDKIRFKGFYLDEEVAQDRNGYITFGTMNASYKITLKAIEIWAKIMHAVPNSRFLYVRPETDSPILKSNFCRYMEKNGIDKSRISFVATHDDHMRYYNEMDIALDTFPHTGGTTTCEALWMGIPVVALVGEAFFERLSYSNLSNSGMDDCCAFSLTQYVETAVSLAHDKKLRIFLKNNLRKKIKDNPLGKPEKFAKDFGNAIFKYI